MTLSLRSERGDSRLCAERVRERNRGRWARLRSLRRRHTRNDRGGGEGTSTEMAWTHIPRSARQFSHWSPQSLFQHECKNQLCHTINNHILLSTHDLFAESMKAQSHAVSLRSIARDRDIEIFDRIRAAARPQLLCDARMRMAACVAGSSNRARCSRGFKLSDTCMFLKSNRTTQKSALRRGHKMWPLHTCRLGLESLTSRGQRM